MKAEIALEQAVAEAVEAARAAAEPVRVNTLVSVLTSRFSLGPDEAPDIERKVLDQASLAGAVLEFDGRKG